MKTTKLVVSSLPSLARRLLPLVSVLSMAAMSGGCGTLNARAPTLSPKLAVDLPTSCERLAVEVPVPGLRDAKGRPLTQRLVLHRTQAALLLANGTIAETRECMVVQRNAYSATP